MFGKKENKSVKNSGDNSGIINTGDNNIINFSSHTHSLVVIIVVMLFIFLMIVSNITVNDSENEIKTFDLKMKRFFERPLLGVDFFDNNECNEPKYNSTPLSEGEYQLLIQIEKSISKTIYMKNELINCRPLELNTNDNKMTFECDIDCNDSKNQKGDCAYANLNPTCERK